MKRSMQLGLFCLGLGFAVPAFAESGSKSESGEAQIEVKLITKKGARYVGLVKESSVLGMALRDKDSLEPGALAADASIKIGNVNGHAYSMGITGAEVDSVAVMRRLDAAAATDQAAKQKAEAAKAWEKENARLAELENQRKSKKEREAAELAELIKAREADKPKLAPAHQQWIDRFPPKEGWVPALKEKLYHQTIILNNRPLTEAEQAWLDNYDTWKPAYDAWLAIEQGKITAEEKAKAEGKEGPKGEDRADASGTSNSDVAAIDPDNPTDEERVLKLPPVSPDVKKPAAIKKDTKKPAPVNANTKKPSNLKNGKRP